MKREKKTDRKDHMDPETRQRVASSGGRATAAKYNMAERGRTGGKTVSLNREHMAMIGRKGALARIAKHNQVRRKTNESEV